MSYQFNLFIPFEKIERARFIKKLKKSVDNINNLDVKENELNSILIGLSPAQSIYEAKKILENEMNKGICKLDDDLMFIPLNEVDNVDLNDKYKNIFSIILAKHIPVVDKKNNTTHIRHEFAFVFNTKNAIKFKDKLKLFSFPIELGSIGYIEKESDESYLLFLDKKITNHYVYQSICKHEFIKEPKDNMIYNLSDIGRYKENTITFIKDGSCCTISPFNYGKYDSLLIL